MIAFFICSIKKGTFREKSKSYFIKWYYILYDFISKWDEICTSSDCLFNISFFVKIWRVNLNCSFRYNAFFIWAHPCLYISFIYIFEASNAHAKPRKVFFVNVLCFLVYFVFIIFYEKVGLFLYVWCHVHECTRTMYHLIHAKAEESWC